MACDVSRVLRHMFSITAIHKGLSRPALQRLLGHDCPTTTEIYLNLSLEDVVRKDFGKSDKCSWRLTRAPASLY